MLSLLKLFKKNNFKTLIPLLPIFLSLLLILIHVIFYQEVQFVRPLEKFIQGNKYYLFEDKANKLTFEDVTSNAYKDSLKNYPENKYLINNTSSAYWIRFKLNNLTDNSLILKVQAYFKSAKLFIPQGNGKYLQEELGLIIPREKWKIKTNDKSYFIIPQPINEEENYYLRLESYEKNFGLGFILNELPKAINRIIDAQLYYGFILGIFVLSLIYSFILFFKLKERFYLFYSLYIFGLTLYAVVSWGILYYVPFIYYSPFSYFFYTVPYLISTISLLFYSKSFLQLKEYLPKINALINIIIASRIMLFIISFIGKIHILNHPYIDAFILVPAFGACLIRLNQNFKPAKFFSLAFSILFSGFLLQSFFHRKYNTIDFSDFITIYNTGVLEIILFSLALGERFKEMREEKDKTQKAIILQLREKEILKDKINLELEEKVAERTEQLTLQAEEIKRINELLKINNIKLQSDVKILSSARVTQKMVTFEEFKNTYPDDESCYKYLYELKWGKSFLCRKCGHPNSISARTPFGKRCTKCKYEESVTAHTIFNKLKFPPIKAFYMLFLLSNKKEVSAEELSNLLSLNYRTCWSYKNKIKEAMENVGNEKSWEKIIFNNKVKKV